MTALQVELWPVSTLVPYQRVVRKNDHAVDRMVVTLREFGLKLPLLVRSDGEIVDGHLRLKAAQKLELTEVPVIRCDEWTEDQVKAFRLVVNRSATWAEWDWDVVATEIAELHQANFDLTLTGFDAREIDRLLTELSTDAEQTICSEDPEPVSRSGDLWICGQHRVLCGDSTSSSDVRLLLQEARPRLMVTDPPYGVEYDPKWREEAGLGRQRQTGIVENDDRVDWSIAYQLFPGDVAYIWHAGIYAADVAASLKSTGFDIRAQIIWAKQHFAMSRGHYHWQHEPCWYAVRHGHSAQWRGGRKESTLWEVSNLNPFGASETEDAITGHSTQKPVELMRRPMFNHTEEGEVVYDPFLGSGSSLIAAERANRICYGLEISPAHVDRIVLRWQKLTGRQAVLEHSGERFDVVAADRQQSATNQQGFPVSGAA
jgi:DNA modification methylase